MDELPEITGVLDLPVPTFSEAMKDIHTFIGGLVSFEASAIAFAERVLATYTPPPSSSSSSSSSSVCPLDLNEVAAVFMYTQECNFYRKVNESLRDPKRKNVAKLKLYLRLFFSALDKIPPFGELLYRGVAKDLRKFYRQVIFSLPVPIPHFPLSLFPFSHPPPPTGNDCHMVGCILLYLQTLCCGRIHGVIWDTIII